MSSVSTPKALPALIDQILTAEDDAARLQLVEHHGALRNRDVLVGIADAVNRIAREDLARAERLAEIGTWLAGISGDMFGMTRIRRSSGNLLVLRGKHAEALQTFDSCIDQFNCINEQIEVAATYSSSLQPLIYLGRYSEALERARRGQEIAKKHKDDLLMARLEVNMGNIFHRQDQFSEAIGHYHRALPDLERLSQVRDCAVAWVNLAVCNISLNEFSEAENCYQMARSIALRENMPSIVAQADYNVAYLYYRRGEYVRAIQQYQQTRQYCKKVSDEYHSALCDLDQAEIYVDLHLNDEGLQLAQQAAATFERMNLGYEAAKALVWLGLSTYQSRRALRAVEIFTTAQERMKREENHMWVALLDFYTAIILQKEGRLIEALRSGKGADAYFSKFPKSGKAIQARLLLGSVHLSLGQISEATGLLESTLRTAECIGSPFLITQALSLRGRIEEARGFIDSATTSYQAALQYMEKSLQHLRGEESKISSSQTRVELCNAMISTMMLGNHGSRGVIANLMEKAKSSELAEILTFRSSTLQTPSRNRSPLVEQVKSLRQELSWYYEHVERAEVGVNESAVQDPQILRSRIQKLEESFVKTLAELKPAEEEFSIIQNGGTVDFDKIRRVIQNDEIMIEFHEARGLFHVALINSDSVHVVPAARGGTVRNLLRSLRTEFEKVERAKCERADATESALSGAQAKLSALFRELIAPIRNYIEGRRLIIIPSGPLHYLPFHALFDGSRYFCDDHPISYAGSGTLYYLSCCKDSRNEERDLILSSQSLGGAHKSDIPSQIRKVLPNATASDTSSDMEGLKQQGLGFRFVHVDTHLRLRQDNAMFSTLGLGQTEISILDSYNLRIPCSLLGLSGTGPGIQATGNGSELHSLASGMEYAGAQSLLMPLWNVSREMQAEFLRHFYERASKESDKPLAFQQTMHLMRERHPHPYFWASFTLRGRTGRPTPETARC